MGGVNKANRTLLLSGAKTLKDNSTPRVHTELAREPHASRSLEGRPALCWATDSCWAGPGATSGQPFFSWSRSRPCIGYRSCGSATGLARPGFCN